MEWLNRMMDALDYMEKNMENPLDINEISRVAYSSPFHFQRMFHMITGFTVAEYIRKRKLTLAAQELAVSKSRVLDIALKYGYDSPESFTKAFRKAHGINPSAAREPGAVLKAFPKISFHLSLKGDKDMDYKMMNKDAFKVYGKAVRITTKDGENFKKVPEFWQACYADGTYENLCKLADGKPTLGICMDMDHSKEEMTYMIAFESDKDFNLKGCEIRDIPNATWAVFTSVGPMPGAIQTVWQRIFQEWFPATGYEHADAPELEVYLPGDPNAADYQCEVWVPVIKNR